MRRFWDSASVLKQSGGFAIQLDKRPLRLPGGVTLNLTSAALAEAIAAEWQAASGNKVGDIQLDSLKLTRLAATTQELVAPARGATVESLAAYAAHDLLCYRAGFPPDLAARQAARWQWLLDRARTEYGAAFIVTAGVMPARQDDAALAAMRAKLHLLSNADLAALLAAVPATASLVLGVSLADGAIAAAEATSLACLDSDFQAEKWGEDAEALARRDAIAADIDAAARFMALSRQT